MPRTEKADMKRKAVDEIADFEYVPKKFYCHKHKETEIDYCCTLNEQFFCKLCLPSH